MKGVIAKCLGELICTKFGREQWETILQDVGLDRKTQFMAIADVDDKTILQVIASACQVLNLSKTQAADAFGDYWVNVFAPKIYGVYYHGITSAKDFLLKMDYVHDLTTKTISNARPPRFEYEWIDEKTLIMKYKSGRGLIDILIGLIKGVGKYYKETLKVEKLSTDKVKIVFL